MTLNYNYVKLIALDNGLSTKKGCFQLLKIKYVGPKTTIWNELVHLTPERIDTFEDIKPQLVERLRQIKGISCLEYTDEELMLSYEDGERLNILWREVAWMWDLIRVRR